MIPENIKNIIEKVEHVLSVSIRGNQEYSESYNTKKSMNLINDHTYYLDDREFVEEHFPNQLDDDLEYDYELRVDDSYYVKTKDKGEVSIDFGSVNSDSGTWYSIDIGEDSLEAKILYDYLITKGNNWTTDDLNDLIKED